MGFDGGYAKPVYEKTKTGLRYRDYYREAKDNLLKQATDLRGIDFSVCDYKDASPNGFVVYCDPPYNNTTGYENSKDFDFETMSTLTDSYSKGFVDILVTLGKKNAAFLIEAKRISKKLTNKDRDQAISYARAKEIRVPFVVVTNGIDIHCFNTI